MNVNLMRIIVHNCCPVIPAIGSVQSGAFILQYFWNTRNIILIILMEVSYFVIGSLSSGKVVLNFCNEVSKIDDLLSLAEMLLTKTNHLLKGIVLCTMHGRLGTDNCANGESEVV